MCGADVLVCACMMPRHRESRQETATCLVGTMRVDNKLQNTLLLCMKESADH